MKLSLKNIHIIFALAWFFVVLVSFYPCLSNDFVNWDDTTHILSNPVVLQDWSWGKAVEIFTNLKQDHYKPLVLLIFSIEYSLFDWNPTAFHLVNCLAHLVNCFLVYWFISLISGNRAAAYLTAVLFSVHPLNVESVAWVSELKGLMSVLWYLASLIAYKHYLENFNRKNLFYSFVFFLLSIMSKSSSVTIIPILFLLDTFTGRKFDKQSLLEKALFLVPTILFASFTLLRHRQQLWHGHFDGFIHADDTFSFLMQFFHGILFYFSKIMMPIGLSCFYADALVLPRISAFLCLIIVILMFIYCCKRHSYRQALFGILFFIFSVIIFLPLRPVADRFTYLSAIGVFYIISMVFLIELRSKRARSFFYKIIICCFIIGIVTTLSYLTRQRCKAWKDTETLWNAAIKHDQKSTMAYLQMAKYLIMTEKYDSAIECLNRAIKIDPSFASAYIDRSSAYFLSGRYDQALLDCHHVMNVLKSANGPLFNVMGLIHSATQKNQEAAHYFTQAINLSPDVSEYHFNRGYAYEKQGLYRQAQADYDEALRLNPGNSMALARRRSDISKKLDIT